MLNLVPGRPRWSVGAEMALNGAWTGATSVGDVQWAAQQLVEAAEETPAAWLAPWSALADRWESRAKDATDSRVAAEARWRAATYLLAAERLIPPGDPIKREVYERALELSEAALPGLSPRMESVSIPFDGRALSALYAQPVGWSSATPTIVCLGGLDTTKELTYAMVGGELVRAGFACLMLEGPGQGQTLRHGGLTLRSDSETWVSAGIDHLLARTPGEHGPLGLVGMSMGGYLAARALAFEPRLDAGVVWGAVWDYYEIWSRRLAPGSPISPDERAQLHWMLGVDDDAAAIAAMEAFRLAEVAPKTTAPVLVVHGADDRAVPVEDARRLTEALGSSDKELVVFDEPNFGSEHVQIDNLPHGSHVVVDWLRSHLTRSPNAA